MKVRLGFSWLLPDRWVQQAVARFEEAPVSGATGPWSWPGGQGPERTVETKNFDEWLESVAAGRGIGVVPDVAMRRNIHSAVRFIPLTNAPTSPVSLAFLPHVRESLMRDFVAAAVAAAAQPNAATGG